jgi:polyhydroxybutyrate depolymerase
MNERMKKRLTRMVFIGLGLALTLVVAAAVSFRLINRTNGRLASAGERRTYLLHVPASYDPARPTPLVISLHGFAEWPAHQAQISRWNDLAEEQGFLVVYPAGTRFPLRWRAGGRINPADPAPDIAFISDLIDALSAEYNLDPARVYANGLSNGGGMAFVLACELSERIAAVGMVAGAYGYAWEKCAPARPAPAIIFHGTADPIVPFEGGEDDRFAAGLPDIAGWVSTLAARNGCAAEPRALPASGAARGVAYTGCGADVVFYTIAGGGHTWPGGEPLPEWLTGITTQDIDATRTMWDFFVQHPLREE